MKLPESLTPPLGEAPHVADLTSETEQRQKAEAALRESELEHRSVVEVLSEGIAVIQADGTISSLNESAGYLCGASAEFLRGKRLTELHWHAIKEDGTRIAHEDHPALVTARTGVPVKECVLGLYQPDHAIRWLSVNTYPLRRASDEPPYAAAVSFTDITERLLHERAMRESYDTLDRLTGEFISVVSHELRTPLTSIRGALKLLESDVFAALPAKASDLLHIARTNAERLMRIINDILDLEQLKSGRMVLHPISLDPAALVGKVVDALRSTADAKHVTVVTKLSLPRTIRADRDRLFHVLEHLLSNAIKFSLDGGEVTVRAIALSPPRILFEVIDHGPGIPRAMLDRLFKSFTQANTSDTRPSGGAGLGLAIAQSTIERMGGEIGAESVQNVRTRVWFELPYTPGDATDSFDKVE